MEPNKHISKISDLSPIDLVSKMKIGWNLGNSMDSKIRSGPALETSWGNPITTKELVRNIKNAGFNVFRLPITWDGHFGEGPDYLIDPAWLDRAEEIANYALEEDMFVIINIHHEYWHMPTYENSERAKTILEKIWLQIAERFEKYDEHIIFEAMNEPRKVGTPVEWDGGDAEGRDVVNQLNAVFVNTVRKSGGNNSIRNLMIPTYAASCSKMAIDGLVLPKDDKLIVSIHAYIPLKFALDAVGTSSFNPNNPDDVAEIDQTMQYIHKAFVSKGVPVILGEFGARDKDNLSDRIKWVDYYLRAAKNINVPCILWDNCAFSGKGELFGMYDRHTDRMVFPEFIQAMMEVYDKQ